MMLKVFFLAPKALVARTLVMLAFGDVELPTEPLTAYTSSTITTREALVEELERVRTRGYVYACVFFDIKY